MKKLILTLTLIALGGAAHAANNDSLLSLVRGLIPPTWETRLKSQELDVRFDLGNAGELATLDFCSPDKDGSAHDLGQARPGWFGSKVTTLRFHRDFVQILKNGKSRARTYHCGHGNTYRLALATILHELSHAVDAERVIDPSARHSQTIVNLSGAGGTAGSASTEYRTIETDRVSGRADFQAMIGFADDQSRGSEKSFHNSSQVGSPNPYEYFNRREYFAVNMEYFLLDDTYGCRRPSHYRYFSQLFRFKPPVRCQKTYPLLMQGSQARLLIDPARVYQVHYFQADKGPSMMSRWGHSMMRLVICAPDRKEVGPECLKDYGSHLIVNFVANVQELELSVWKGLRGNYPSQIFIRPYQDVVNSYTIGEFRALQSYPMLLSSTEKTMMVEKVVENFWGMQGKYKFFSNNCASEAYDLARSALWNRTALLEKKVALETPNAVRKALVSVGLIDGAPISPDLPYTIASYLDSAQTALEIIAKKTGRHLTVDEYLSVYSLKDRLALAKDHLADAVLVLEIVAHERLKQNIDLSNSTALGKIKDQAIKLKVESFFNALAQLDPWAQVKSGSWGIPLPTEILGMEKVQVIQKKMHAIKTEFKSIFSDLDESNKKKMADEMDAMMELAVMVALQI